MQCSYDNFVAILKSMCAFAATKTALVDAKKVSEKMKEDYNVWRGRSRGVQLTRQKHIVTSFHSLFLLFFGPFASLAIYLTSCP